MNVMIPIPAATLNILIEAAHRDLIWGACHALNETTMRRKSELHDALKVVATAIQAERLERYQTQLKAVLERERTA
jgi:hypothetical protein